MGERRRKLREEIWRKRSEQEKKIAEKREGENEERQVNG